MVYIDSAVACIVAREFLEAALFINSYFGAVYLNEKIEAPAKKIYYSYMIIALVVGISCALAIALGVGFGLKAAFESGNGMDAQLGMEIGEAVSKLIGFFFVVKMMFQVPKWFGISNYEVLDDEEDHTKISSSALEMAPRTLAFYLFWQFFREMTETGCFVAIEVILSDQAYASLGQSLGVGLGSAIGVFLIIFLGSSFTAKRFFGIFISVVIEMLAVGLITGSMHSWEETHEMRGYEPTPLVWGSEDMDVEVYNSVQVLAFFGLGGRMHTVEFVFWIASILSLTYLQISHNYYGNPLPDPFKYCIGAIKRRFSPLTVANVKAGTIGSGDEEAAGGDGALTNDQKEINMLEGSRTLSTLPTQDNMRL